MDYDCRPPDVHIHLNKSHSSATRITTVDMFVVVGKVKTRCNTSSTILYTWERNAINDLNGVFTSSQTIASHNLTIEPKSLPVGLYFIRLIAEMTKEEGALGYDFGFLEVVLPDLVAKIRGPKKAVKGTGNIVLDATDSFDPENPAAKDQGMFFTWFCRRGDEDFSNIQSFPIDSSPGRDKMFGGCFGYGVGVMNTTGPILEININGMVSQSRYVFKVVVEKESRTSSTNHTLVVESSISFSIR